MSNLNLNPEEAKSNAAYLEINENGELKVKDPHLAKALQELSPEELEGISGGGGNNCNCTIGQKKS
jgi:hypothetical protein